MARKPPRAPAPASERRPGPPSRGSDTRPARPAKSQRNEPSERRAGPPSRGGPPARGPQRERPAARVERPDRPAIAAPVLDASPAPVGAHLWTTREQYEADLAEELGPELGPRIMGPGLVASKRAPKAPAGVDAKDVWPAFARQGFVVDEVVRANNLVELGRSVAHALKRRAKEKDNPQSPWALHVWVPDTERHNRLAKNAEVLQRSVELVAPTIDASWADRRVATARLSRDNDGVLAQVAFVEPGLAYVGGGPAANAASLHSGGRARMRVDDAAPSRAAMKLEEALDWLGFGPAAGELCVDLGAAPGGWTWVALNRGARVITVDPGELAPEIAARREVTHVHGSAFDYEPDGPVDWLLCDMVWRPLEVANLLGRWAKRRWARLLLANVKLPMKHKAEFLVRIRAVLEESGWRAVRMRQLYHDREEITLTAHCAR